MCAEDRGRVQRFYEQLSTDTVYRRFFTASRPAAAELRRLFDTDPGGRDALVAVAGDDAVGLAEGARPRHQPEAVEIGVVVADAWQGSGIGGRLVRALVHRAAARGAVTIQADTLADNYRMARLMRRIWPAARPVLDGSVHTWCVPIAPHCKRSRGARGDVVVGEHKSR
jgi:RimJ/RimL family protein N-acetyltransferase